jgi:hypothetical protein
LIPSPVSHSSFTADAFQLWGDLFTVRLSYTWLWVTLYKRTVIICSKRQGPKPYTHKPCCWVFAYCLIDVPFFIDSLRACHKIHDL